MAASKRKLVVFQPFVKELAVFEKEYGSILVDCKTPAGMKSAKACRLEIRDARSNLEDARKAAKAPVLAQGTRIDDEAKSIKAKLDTLFGKFDSPIKAIENAKEIAAQAAVDAALKQVADFEEREAAILEKEYELGLKERPPEQEVEEDDVEDVVGDSDGTAGVDSGASDSDSANASVICEPHIKAASIRLASLKKVRALVEPTDPQPDSGEINEKTAAQHDAVLAKIWEIVDEYQ